MAITPGEQIEFSKEVTTNLGAIVREICDDLEQSHDDMFNEISEQWEHYDAEPLVERRTDPYDDASNIVIPTVAIHADGTVARYMQLLSSGPDIWTGRSDNEDFVKAGFAREIPRFLNWSARNEYDFYGPVGDWVNEIVVVGSSVLTLGWRTDTRKFFTGIKGKKGTVQSVVVKRGPYLEHIPRERALWDVNFPAWASPVFSRQSFLSWNDIVMRVNEDGWDGEAADRIKGQTVGHRGSSGKAVEIHVEKADRVGIDIGDTMVMNSYDIREVWVSWPVVKGTVGEAGPKDINSDDEIVTLVFFIHMDSGEVMKITNKPLLIPDNPFYDAYFKKRSGQYTSHGTGRMLRDIQSGQSALINQAIDVVHVANGLQSATTDPRLANTKLQPGVMPLVTDKDAIIPLRTDKFVAPDIAVFTQLNVIAERRTGISDPALGRETRMGGHPAPATSTLQLLQQGKQLDVLAMRSIRSAISKMGLDKAAIYQQLETNEDGKIERAMGTKDAQVLNAWLFPTEESIIGNLELDLAAVDEVMNPQVDQQKALMSFQATANYFALVMQHLQVSANPQLPPAVRAVGLKAIEGLSTAFGKILESNDIDNLEAFTLDLQQLASSLTGGGQQAGGPPGGAPQQGVGGGNGSAAGAPGGAGGAPFGSGL